VKAWISLCIGPYDHPVAEVILADEDDDLETEAMTLWLTDDISLTGARTDVERWVRDLATQVAMKEGDPA
jgi:hypothetical protein